TRFLSHPEDDIKNPLSRLSDEKGFDAQEEEVTTKLSHRFYAFNQWQESQDTAKESVSTRTARTTTARVNTCNAETEALVSMVNKLKKSS
ncbi:M23 family peptidase, partial [Pseudoalteromonas sp. S1727]